MRPPVHSSPSLQSGQSKRTQRAAPSTTERPARSITERAAQAGAQGPLFRRRGPLGLLVFSALVLSSGAAGALIERRELQASDPTGRGQAPASSRPTESLARGPWGELELHEVVLEPRAGYLRPDMCRTEQPLWQLPGMSKAQVPGFAAAAGLSPGRRDAFFAFSQCGADGCVARPGFDFIAALSPVERAGLYGALGRFDGNATLRVPMRRRPGEIERTFRDAGLDDASLSLLRGVLYRDGAFEAFTDMALLCSRIASEEQKGRLMAGIVRTPTLLLTLRVPPGADVDALARYWAVGGRSKDIHALLASLARSPEGGSIDVVHLLPRFVRARLNTFAEPTEPAYDCIYSALNFLARSADDKFLDLAVVKRTIAEDYRPLAADEPPRLGDLILFAQADGTLLHAVAHVAGDVVFNKSGGAFHWPWALARRSELEAQFGNPIVTYMRKKSLEAAEAGGANPANPSYQPNSANPG